MVVESLLPVLGNLTFPEVTRPPSVTLALPDYQRTGRCAGTRSPFVQLEYAIGYDEQDAAITGGWVPAHRCAAANASNGTGLLLPVARTNVAMLPGFRYVAAVRATTAAGLRTVVNGTFVLYNSPPTAAQLRIRSGRLAVSPATAGRRWLSNGTSVAYTLANVADPVLLLQPFFQVHCRLDLSSRGASSALWAPLTNTPV